MVLQQQSFICQRKQMASVVSDKTKDNSRRDLVPFDVSALFTCIPIPVAFEVINRKFTEYINQTGMETFLEHIALYLQTKLSLFWK